MENMIDMLKSLYCYNYGTNNRYYKELEEKHGAEQVAKAWEEIKQKYDVIVGVYEDSEGVTYNTLIEKEGVKNG